jgi:hypothetical protein
MLDYRLSLKNHGQALHAIGALTFALSHRLTKFDL